MDGFRVMTMEDAAPIGDIFCTLTGNMHVLRSEHFSAMKDGAVICELGALQRRDRHPGARRSSRAASRARCGRSSRSTWSAGKRVFLLGEGRLINLAAAEGHPASVMDMSFANQSLGAEYLVKERKSLVERRASRAGGSRSRDRAPQAAGDGLDTWTCLPPAQQKYLASWDMGT